MFVVYSPADDTVPMNIGSALLIELPADSPKRATLLAAYNELDRQVWGDDSTPTNDSGQKYLYFNLDA